MKEKIRDRLSDDVSKGGLMGALIGVVASFFYHRKEDKVYRNAGKTAVLGGFGYLAGEWLERWFTGKKRNKS